MQKVKALEVVGIILDFIGAMLLASAILHYSSRPWKDEKLPRWSRQRGELEYIDDHLQKTKKIATHAMIILSIGFIITLTAVILKKP
jgi:hypothetical protein